MARREVTQFFDDFDNTPLSEDEVKVVDFTVNGVDYTLDLSPENSQKFDDAVQPFVQVARRKPRSGKRVNRTTNPGQNKRIREWAKKNNISVSSRGRISADVIERFEKDQGK
ncbi:MULTISPECIES: histone-like nucleoid-structuring protein Lsr2 [Corynebacterium]|uniref:Histone n=1 Tax=Corynebacterium auriscanis TaxID=99807 RepID=A0A0A2DG20_9CORY|nr:MULTISPECIES: Lsr2 family protein [Corynebacterium]KGM18115.1 histone [Corynebacterium auriscanis]OFT91457.1 histone [Corynebacterium sp. HMSC28B08]WJY71854.1 Nucleoid-associated protein Lsr2 [Corynebacterium auriscanis]